MNFCPLCEKKVTNVDRHLLRVHRTSPKTGEQSVLCKLGRDRTLLERVECQCPISGCTAVVTHVKHHLRNVHGGLSKVQMELALRPLRWERAMCELRDLRAKKGEPPLVTDLDIHFFAAKEAGVAVESPRLQYEHKCRKKQCEQKDHVNGKMRKQLSIAQNVSRDLLFLFYLFIYFLQ